VQKHLPDWFSKNANQTPNEAENTPSEKVTSDAQTSSNQQTHLELAKESLKKLLEDSRVPENIRSGLRNDFQQLQAMLNKLEQGHIHIAVFGRVSVGKSSLLNALIGKEHFSVSLLHGETKQVDMSQWDEYADGNIYLMDTPGINEISGEEREQMAHDAASRADLLLFVVDSDLTESEISALKVVAETQRPIILVINKADQYTEKEQLALRSIIRDRTKNIVAPENIVFTTAQSIQQNVIYVDENGNEHESIRTKPKDVTQLKTRLWDIMEAEGQTLSALNASLFAGNLSNEVSQRILATRQEVGRKLIHYYCLGKGVAVALNPIPVADLFAAAAVDAGMIAHLSKIYGLPMTRHETGELVRTIIAQLLLLIGTTWATHLISSALKLGTGGLSTVITAATQGAVAWYSTLVIGKVAEAWLANGKSWGDAGPKLTVQNILDNLDRDSVMAEAKEEILGYLKKK
jgi:small GTP-binding protein